MLGKMVKRGVLAMVLGVSVSLSTVVLAQEGEKPFSADEIQRFMADYPAMIQWNRKKQGDQAWQNHPWMIAGLRYNKEFVEQLAAKGWKSDRFFYIFNHLNQGLMIRKTQQQELESRKRMQEQMKRLQAESRARAASNQEEMAAAAQQRVASMTEQLDAEERRIRQNPYMNPMQRRQALDLLQQQRQFMKQSVNPGSSMQDWQEQMRQSQKQAILRNPYISAAQKYWMIRQMQANKVTATPSNKAAMMHGGEHHMGPGMDRESMFKQQKAWVARQKAAVANNPFIPPQQRELMKRNMDQYLQKMEEGMRADHSEAGSLPKVEMELVERYGDQLMKIFQQP
ncbi:MAG: hypothetical protein HQL84_06850 [Magnetococcales bacterium]|nr:hypothetical protein [Magnetococcales bacterium]MBF0149750.1 hypothetical protein [Magnetococcales bacterium]MBF0174517.1 hypothetical protein [Magnetococcales bacterium]MBF0348169.1 hypothetical protein [Magnetococcales bacterium]MBF0630689.1 hypothetical protein [Magnetococcales bacterium]